MANAERLGKRLMARLAEIADERKVVAKPRGLGLMCALNVVSRRTGKGDAKRRDRILQAAFERGLILLGCGEHAIRFCPPLCINEAQLDIGLRLFDEAVATVV